jgi:hypothetical protein
LPLSATELVGTTAALFLQDLVQKSILQSSTKKEAGLCTVSDIQAVIDQTPDLRFVLKQHSSLAEGLVEPERLVAYQPPAKRKKRTSSTTKTTTTTTTTTRTANQVMKNMAPEASSSSIAAAALNSEQIVLDEDDYD